MWVGVHVRSTEGGLRPLAPGGLVSPGVGRTTFHVATDAGPSARASERGSTLHSAVLCAEGSVAALPCVPASTLGPGHCSLPCVLRTGSA